jgi:hypothetical protein
MSERFYREFFLENRRFRLLWQLCGVEVRWKIASFIVSLFSDLRQKLSLAHKIESTLAVTWVRVKIKEEMEVRLLQRIGVNVSDLIIVSESQIRFPTNHCHCSPMTTGLNRQEFCEHRPRTGRIWSLANHFWSWTQKAALTKLKSWRAMPICQIERCQKIMHRVEDLARQSLRNKFSIDWDGRINWSFVAFKSIPCRACLTGTSLCI